MAFESAAQTSPFAAIVQQEMAGTGVKVGEVMEDMGAPEKRFSPGHPDADKNGYVAFPRGHGYGGHDVGNARL